MAGINLLFSNMTQFFQFMITFWFFQDVFILLLIFIVVLPIIKKIINYN
jgi:hypothetical protein